VKKQNIVLVGFRGSGKARFGRAIAKVLGLPFADLDAEVAFVLGEPIDTFVDKFGWQEFRAVEQRVVHDFSRNFSGVIATGGGTIENSKNLQNLKKNGFFVFLNPSFMKIRKFLISQDAQSNYRRVNPELSLIQEIDQLWAQRKDIYFATADVEVIPDFNGDEGVEAQKMVEQLPANILPISPSKKRVALFSSSNGSTIQGLFEAQAKGRIPNVEFVLFITDKSDAGSLKKAKTFGIKECQIVEQQKDETREEYDRALINMLRNAQPDVILLAGWMKILSPLFCEQFGQTTWNVHPSLLPDHAGLMGDAVHTEVLNNEDRYTGCSIHRVSAEVDTGEMILQRKIPVEETDTVDSLRTKVQRQEILGFCEGLERR